MSDFLGLVSASSGFFEGSGQLGLSDHDTKSESHVEGTEHFDGINRPESLDKAEDRGWAGVIVDDEFYGRFTTKKVEKPVTCDVAKPGGEDLSPGQSAAKLDVNGGGPKEFIGEG